jgi:hypothetical protein
MLTTDQTIIRLQDAEIKKLREEVVRVTARATKLKDGFAEILITVAGTLPYPYNSRLLNTAEDLKSLEI